MDIVVMGKGKLNFKPDQIVINFDFNAKEKTYEQVLQQGTAGVEKYLNLLLNLGFKKADFKTRSFRVSENREYDNVKRIYVSKGYVFSQSARIKFDYDMEKLSQLMEKTSAFDDAPAYRIDFAIKDEKSAEEELLKQQQFQKRDKYFNKKKFEQRNRNHQETQEVVTEEKTEQ